ncbi:MAG: hypothetical protein ACRD1T_27160, partial [Acidimicrobiia bacterium]
MLSPPIVMAGLLIISPALPGLLDVWPTVCADPLFAALSALGLWQLLSFYHDRHVGHLGLSSGFLGLATLARSEGTILCAALALAAILVSGSLKRVPIVLLTCAIPFAIVVGGYLVYYRFVTGQLYLGTSIRTYHVFEGAHDIAYGVPPGEPFDSLDGVLRTRELFGTPVENQYSIFRAIRRNPQAYLERLVKFAGLLPSSIEGVYASGLSFAFFLFPIRGVIELVRRRQNLLLFLLLLWLAYLPVYFLFCVLSRYFYSAYFVVLLLASIGVTSLVRNLDAHRERYVWSVSLAAIGAIAVVANQPQLFLAAAGLLLGLWILWLVLRSHQGNASLT